LKISWPIISDLKKRRLQACRPLPGVRDNYTFPPIISATLSKRKQALWHWTISRLIDKAEAKMFDASKTINAVAAELGFIPAAFHPSVQTKSRRNTE